MRGTSAKAHNLCAGKYRSERDEPTASLWRRPEGSSHWQESNSPGRRQPQVCSTAWSATRRYAPVEAHTWVAISIGGSKWPSRVSRRDSAEWDPQSHDTVEPKRCRCKGRSRFEIRICPSGNGGAMAKADESAPSPRLALTPAEVAQAPRRVRRAKTPVTRTETWV
jgi:hypothetical protein